MSPSSLVAALARFPHVLSVAVAGLDDEDARWRPRDDDWSVVEVVSHLADEEVDDFRARLRRTLERPEADWDPIDPVGWATARGYRSRSLSEPLARFLAERARSLQWLEGLGDPAAIDWARAHPHPRFGPIRAGDLLTAWADHDLLHLRQITKRRHEMVLRDGSPYAARYAGEW